MTASRLDNSGRTLAQFSSEARARTMSVAEWTIAKQCLLDWLGVALRGASEPVACQARSAARAWGAESGDATVIGSSMAASVCDAAMLNAIAGHALDYDDTTIGPFAGHPSAVILPALTALAEARAITVVRVLEAFSVGVRTGSLLGSWANPAHHEHGWHPTATLGVFAAAAGCSALLDLSVEQTSVALALAATHASGLRSAFGSPAKPVQVGHAASDGLRCALLADQGVGPIADTIGGPDGFLAAYAGAGDDDLPPDGLESIRFKGHACCHCTHAAIDAATAIGVDPLDILDVEVQVARGLDGICGIEDPQTGLELKFSLRGVTTLALFGTDTTDPATFSDSWKPDDRYRGLHRRVRIRYVDGLSDYQARVTARTGQGQTLRQVADASAGCPPASGWSRLTAKFRRLAAPVVGSARTDEIVRFVHDSDGNAPIASLLALCRLRDGCS